MWSISSSVGEPLSTRWPARSPWQRRNPGGFTLLEILAVAVVLTIIGVLVLPNMFGQIARAELDAASDRTVALLQLLRIEAMQRGQPIRLRYDHEKNQWLVETRLNSAERRRRGVIEDLESQRSDGFVPFEPQWTAEMSLPSGVFLAKVIARPVSLRLLLAEYERRKRSGELTSSSGRSTFELPKFDEDDDDGLEPVDDDRFSPIQFEPDGTLKDDISLRLIFLNRTEKSRAANDIQIDLDAAEADELDPKLHQRWITIEAVSGQIYAVDPPMAIIELANDFRTDADFLELGGAQ